MNDPSNANNPRLVESIPARSDCEEGPILFDLLMKDGFAKSSLNAYIAETLSQQTTLTQVQYLRSRLLSEQGATLVNETLTDFFHSEAAKDVIHDALRIYLQKEYPRRLSLKHSMVSISNGKINLGRTIPRSAKHRLARSTPTESHLTPPQKNPPSFEAKRSAKLRTTT